MKKDIQKANSLSKQSDKTKLDKLYVIIKPMIKNNGIL